MNMSTETETPLDRAKRLAGGAVGLAAKLTELDRTRPVSSQAISQWKKAPADRAVDVQTVTGVPCHELRPDVFKAAGQAA